jgi:hypothetical protein
MGECQAAPLCALVLIDFDANGNHQQQQRERKVCSSEKKKFLLRCPPPKNERKREREKLKHVKNSIKSV